MCVVSLRSHSYLFKKLACHRPKISFRDLTGKKKSELLSNLTSITEYFMSQPLFEVKASQIKMRINGQ